MLLQVRDKDAARNHPQLETCHRTWLEDDRSWFIRWRDGAQPRIVGLVKAYQLPEMACRVELRGFGDGQHPALDEYAGLLRQELEAEGFA